MVRSRSVFFLLRTVLVFLSTLIERFGFSRSTNEDDVNDIDLS